jgi:NAD(P)-dependent dehydrogenase (short-subunit alcohol dehydrogenase family)
MSNEIFNPFSLKGKTILVTGASSGIGQAIAIETAKAGAEVILSARNLERLQNTRSLIQESCGQEARIVAADLTQQSEIENLVAELPEIDGVVVCVGQGTAMPVKMATPEKFHELFNTNFYSVTELVRLLFKKKTLKKASSVVLISSVGGNFTYLPGNVIYGSTKAALNAYMRFAAGEFASRLIRVNCICPGMIDTPLVHKAVMSDEQIEAYLTKYPLKRFGKPEEIAYASIYLLSDASAWVTGTAMVVDGGLTIRN